MSFFKCKMCGGALEINNNETVATCEYCGTQQTLPKLDDERRTNMYDRANHFRRNNEFDKAMGIYEQILNEDSTDAEAYWSLVLCRFGIEYVEDPASHKRVPTVNRAQFTSIYDDDNYKSALQYADGYQRSIYEKEAKAINEIQKGILAISEKEEPFDVFICYKESDNNGRRTPDSVLANDLYHQLTQEGFKVFFARITLEDKLGSAYEPYIFAALNSAKVMVVLGTKPEYFNAVWVKNEWSRYLSLIKQGQKKMLIPAYKDMDPYDLPEEFSHLQAQDMGRLGFMQDLIRGIKKIAQTDTPKTTFVKETVISGGGVNVAPLLERVFMFLEDGNFESADEYCEKVLDIDPKNAEAYLGKLLSELRVRKQEALKDQAEPFDHSNNYQKAVRFGSNELKAELNRYIEHINKRVFKEQCEATYVDAKEIIKIADEANDFGFAINKFKEAIEILKIIVDFKDSNELIKYCNDKISERTEREENLRIEKQRLAELAHKEAVEKAKRNKRIAMITSSIVCVIIGIVILINCVIIPNSKYNKAVTLMDAGNLDEAYSIFTELGDYKDVADKAGDIRLAKTKVELKDIKAGNYIKFGAYEQDNDTSNGKEDVEWLVLEVKDGKALVISKYALDCKPYNTSYTDVTWETCTLRKWLNSKFYNDSFSSGEKALISIVSVSAEKNPKYKTDAGNATQDSLFLLSINEVYEFFSNDSERQCKTTNYAVSKEPNILRDDGNCDWWLRSPGDGKNGVALVYSSGSICESGNYADNPYVAVRPALWIELGN